MKALILVDIQNDFMPGGALAVPNGDQVVAAANELAPRFELVVASQDWHPPNHSSFAGQHPGSSPGDRVEIDGLEQVLWPDHCVQDTRGAELHSGLVRRNLHHIVRKGVDRRIDSYSAFFDNARRRATGLADYLSEKGVGSVTILGLATDYCVKYTALDAVDLGLETTVALDGCRGIELLPGDVDKAISEMREAGVGLA